MAEATAPAADAPRKKGLLARLLMPLILLLAGAAAGAAGAIFVPTLMPAHDGETPPAPEPSPIEYVEIDNSFTANLKDSGRFVQLRIAVSTNGGKTVVDEVARHRLAIIAAVLAVLTDAAEAELNAPGGRERLAARMRMAINDVLQRKSGVAGIDDVFLTSFVLQ